MRPMNATQVLASVCSTCKGHLSITHTGIYVHLLHSMSQKDHLHNQPVQSPFKKAKNCIIKKVQ